MKVKNNFPFQAVGTMWSMWIPDGVTIKIYMSSDGNPNHYSEIGQDSVISGPDNLQVMGFNQNTYFYVTGLPDDYSANILL